MTEKIRVLHCIETIASGGVEQTLLTLIRGLDKKKFHHRIICTWKGGPIAKALEAEGVDLIPIGSFKHPLQWSKHKQVLRVIREFKPHIIHGAIFEGMSMAAIGGKLGKVPITILEETSDPQNRSKKANFLLRLMSNQADVIQAISGNVGRYLIEKTGVKKDKIRVVLNGLSLSEKKEESELDQIQEYLALLKNELVIGFVGRLFDDHKRVSDLIKAVKLTKSDSLKVLIIGDGPDKKSLMALVNQFGLMDQVMFAGYQSHNQNFYSMMDVLVVPSSREGFGLVAVEAMLHGLPVIATKVGGLQDIVLDQETGYLVPPLSPESLAEKIQILIEQPELRQEMGEKGKQRALEHFSAERYCREVENLYLELLERKGFL
ncbi:glycosyltransferase [Algoriphagus formosus]|uniref:glycosyltransferase n=1 Tax=Algoriphagus formosus TaxID=2007308 RepID=UPI000C293569|nr:glycosyltransferase [Algoriphagus formosus]